MTVEVYSKPNCPLCEDAWELLQSVRARLKPELRFELRKVDITQDPALFERHRYDIPVVFIDGHKAFKHRVTEEALLARLRR